MKRKEAVKNIGLLLGVATSIPTLTNILQSCDESTKWIPLFFKKNEANLISLLVDTYIPKTDTPSGTEMKVPEFVDRYIYDCVDTNYQTLLRQGMEDFKTALAKINGSDNIKNVIKENIIAVLNATITVSRQQDIDNKKIIEDYITSLTNKANESIIINNLAKSLFLFYFLTQLRTLIIWGYKISKYVGEKVLAYNPIPGQQIGCGALQELSKGRAWTLPYINQA